MAAGLEAGVDIEPLGMGHYLRTSLLTLRLGLAERLEIPEEQLHSELIALLLEDRPEQTLPEGVAEQGVEGHLPQTVKQQPLEVLGHMEGEAEQEADL